MKVFFNRIFQNRNCLTAASVFCVLSGIYLVYNMLYPWRGDDFLIHVQLREMSVFEAVKSAYTDWTLRLGNVICPFFEFCTEKTFFNICNTVVQVVLVWFFCGTAVGRFPEASDTKDTFLLIFTAGISVFVCRPSDTVYWVPGATLYSWAALVYLGCITLLFKFEKCEKVSRWKYILLFFAGFCAGYTNENVALAGLVFLVGRAFFKSSSVLWTTFAGWFAGAVFLFTTPGALNRIAEAGGNKLTISGMIAKLPEISGFYAASSLIPLLFFVLLLAVTWKKLSRKVLLRAGVIMALSVFCALVFAGCPLPPMRSYYVCSVLVIMACCVIFDGADLSFRQRKVISVITLAAGCGTLCMAAPDFLRIYQDETVRKQLIAEQRAENMDMAVVPEHRTLRKSFMQYIFIEDITTDPEFWLNVNAAQYFEVKKIRSTPSGVRVPLFRDRFMKFLKSGGK